MNNRRRAALVICGSAIAAVILYVFFHELGHCLAAIYCGAQITEFSILRARMNYSGGNFTDFTDLCLQAGGALLPLILSFVYMLLYDDRRESLLYRIFSWFISLIPAASMLAWVFIPLLFIFGYAPAGDDVTKFLYNFAQDHSPILVSGVALLVIAAAVILMVKKRIPQNFVCEMKKLRQTGFETNTEA